MEIQIKKQTRGGRKGHTLTMFEGGIRGKLRCNPFEGVVSVCSAQ